MCVSKLSNCAGSAAAILSVISLSEKASGLDLDLDGIVSWEQDLPCNRCIRAGFTYVYENDVNGVYYKEIPRGKPYTGFCCKFDENTNEYTCEIPPPPEPTTIADMWAHWETTEQAAYLARTKTMKKYLERVTRFEGEDIESHILNKLVDAQNAKDTAAFTAIETDLKKRVLHNEMKFHLGLEKAIQYM